MKETFQTHESTLKTSEVSADQVRIHESLLISSSFLLGRCPTLSGRNRRHPTVTGSLSPEPGRDRRASSDGHASVNGALQGGAAQIIPGTSQCPPPQEAGAEDTGRELLIKNSSLFIMIYACFTEPGSKRRGVENSFISAHCVWVPRRRWLVFAQPLGRWRGDEIMDRM